MSVNGLVCRVEHQRAHRRFVREVKPDTILVDLIDARQIVKKDMTASDYYGHETDVIVTSTIPDQKLEMISWERERDIIRDFQPEYHIPTDYPVYSTHSREKRITNLENLMKGTAWMRGELVDTGTRIIPLVKGYTLLERELCYRAIGDMELDTAAFYGTQYFTEKVGQIGQLVEDLESINRESDLSLFLIGLLSPEYVARVPENVTAVAGEHQWRKRVEPRENDAVEMREEYKQLQETIAEQLHTDD